MKTLKATCTAAILALSIFAGCKKEDTANPSAGNPTNNNNPNATTPNSMIVKMTDAPGDYMSLDMEIVGVEAYNGKGWVVLSNETKTVNVLSLTNGAEMQLAAKSQLEAGAYTKLKIKFGDHHKLTLNDTAVLGGAIALINADLEFDGSKEVEIEINEQVNAQGAVIILVDFDVERSVERRIDKYVVKPAIRQIHDARTGMQGRVQGAVAAAVVVTDGTNTFSAYLNAEGHFMMRGIKPGVYRMTIIPARKMVNGMMPKDKTIEGVVVADGQIKEMGTIQL